MAAHATAEATTNTTTTTTADARAAVSALSQKIYFRPALFWQEVQPWHIVDAGLEFRMNFETKKNEARFPSSLEIESNPNRLEDLKRKSRCTVPSQDGRDDKAALEKRLCSAATWNRHEEVNLLLMTCYVTREIAIHALFEAVSRGSVESVELLLLADANLVTMLHPKYGKNVVHVAAECGQEKILSLLVELAPSRRDIVDTRDEKRGLSVFDILRANDMGGILRRIQKTIKRKFPPILRVRSASLEDASNIYEIVNKAYSIEIGNEGIAFKTNDRFDTIDEVKEMIECFVLLVEDDGEDEGSGGVAQHNSDRIVGVSGVVMHDDGIGTFGPFAVHSLEQKRGLGTRLLRETEKRLLDLGCDRVEIDVVNHRADLFPFYKKNGYKVTGERREIFAEENHKVVESDVLTRPSHYVILSKELTGV